MQVVAKQDREPLAQFLVRLCAGVGGLVAVSQMVCGVLQAAISFYCCRKGAIVVGQPAGGGPPAPASTADLMAPGERVKRGPAPAAAVASPPPAAQSSSAVTLQEAERLINSKNS